MAQKKKESSGELFGAVVMIAIAIITPVVVIIGYFYNQSKANTIKNGLKGNKYDFWLSSQEKKEFKKKYTEYLQVLKIIDEAQEKGERANISKNKNGSFSARSKLGKELRNTIEKCIPYKKSLNEEVTYMIDLPSIRWEEFNTYLGRVLSFKLSLFGWISTILYYLLIAKVDMKDDYTTPLLVAGVVAIIFYGIAQLFSDKAAEKYTPIPDKVSFENIDMNEDTQNFQNQNIIKKEEKKGILSILSYIYFILVIIYWLYNFFYAPANSVPVEQETNTFAKDKNIDMQNDAEKIQISQDEVYESESPSLLIEFAERTEKSLTQIMEKKLYKDLKEKYNNLILIEEEQDDYFDYFYLGFDEGTHTTRHSFVRVRGNKVEYTFIPPSDESDWEIMK